MAKQTTVVLLLAFVLIASLALPIVEGKGDPSLNHNRGCKQPSKTMPTCKEHLECDKKCKEAEKAKGGGLCRDKKYFCYMC